MMKQLLSTIVIAICTIGIKAQFADPNSHLAIVDSHDKEAIEWWLAASRGLWSGYMKVQHHGFYYLD